MESFKDTKGRIWVVSINVATIKQVRAVAGVDLLKVLEPDNTLLEQLQTNPVTLCDVLYAVCKGQADELNLTDVEFLSAMAGDAIEHATTCVINGIVSFIASPKQRDVLRRAIEADRRLRAKGWDLVTSKVESGYLEKIQEAELVKLAGRLEKSGDSSTPAPA